MEWAALWPWRGAGLAGLVALAVALGAGAMARPRIAALAAGIGALAGWWLSFGLLTATPRQLPERLPLLMLGLVLLAGFGGGLVARWRWLAVPLAALGALGAGWWMAGAPLVLADLRRAAEVLLLVGGFALALVWRGEGRWNGGLAAAALLAGLWVAAAAGPQTVLGAVLLAAALGALPAAGGTRLGALPLMAGVAALAALPVIARGAPADWAAALAPGLALWLGPALGGWLPRRAAPLLGPALAAAPAVLAAFLLR